MRRISCIFSSRLVKRTGNGKTDRLPGVSNRAVAGAAGSFLAMSVELGFIKTQLFCGSGPNA